MDYHPEYHSWTKRDIGIDIDLPLPVRLQNLYGSNFERAANALIEQKLRNAQRLAVEQVALLRIRQGVPRKKSGPKENGIAQDKGNPALSVLPSPAVQKRPRIRLINRKPKKKRNVMASVDSMFLVCHPKEAS